jgi:hypothetical protein
MTMSLDGLVLDAVLDSDMGGGACGCDPALAAATPVLPGPHAGEGSARARPALQVSWCSMKLSTLHTCIGWRRHHQMRRRALIIISDRTYSASSPPATNKQTLHCHPETKKKRGTFWLLLVHTYMSAKTKEARMRACPRELKNKSQERECVTRETLLHV